MFSVACGEAAVILRPPPASRLGMRSFVLFLAIFGPPGRGADEISRAWGIYLRHIIGHREGAHMKLAGPGPFTRHLMESVFLLK